jgi:hypothetical protein
VWGGGGGKGERGVGVDSTGDSLYTLVLRLLDQDVVSTATDLSQGLINGRFRSWCTVDHSGVPTKLFLPSQPTTAQCEEVAKKWRTKKEQHPLETEVQSQKQGRSCNNATRAYTPTFDFISLPHRIIWCPEYCIRKHSCCCNERVVVSPYC